MYCLCHVIVNIGIVLIVAIISVLRHDVGIGISNGFVVCRCLKFRHRELMHRDIHYLVVVNLPVIVCVSNKRIGHAITVGINDKGMIATNVYQCGIHLLSVGASNGLIVEHLHIRAERRSRHYVGTRSRFRIGVRNREGISTRSGNRVGLRNRLGGNGFNINGGNVRSGSGHCGLRSGAMGGCLNIYNRHIVSGLGVFRKNGVFHLGCMYLFRQQCSTYYANGCTKC